MIGTVTINSGGSLVLTFNTNATQSAVNETIQSIAYSNTSEGPPASVQIDWNFNDNNGGPQGTGGALSGVGYTIVNITSVNDNDPVATDDGFTLNEGATFDTTVADLLDSGFASVLGNDSDADLPNDTLTVSLDTDVSFGTLTLNADGTFDYTHNGSENFSDSFVYAVSDANGGVTDTGTVTITVTPVNDNDPVATDDSFTLNEGAAFDTTTGDLLDSGFASVLGNDSDADLPNDTLTVSLDTDVNFGSLTLNADGTFDYTHNGSENFSDSFVYAVSDANGGVTDTGTVTITITPVNDNDPAATDDSFTLNEGATFDMTVADLLDSGFASVLGNDSDADLPNDTLTVSLDTDVSFGTLTLNADGTFDYTHNGSENFSDSFVYAVSDANGGVTDTGTVTITVTPVNDNDPVATDDSFTLNEGAAFDTTAADLLDSGFASVLGNDSDADLPNDTLTVSLDTDVNFGSLTLNADGTFDYTHNGSENFSDSFVYAVSDANGGVTDTGTVTITVTPVNDNDPVATNDSFTLNEGATFDTTAADLLDSGFASVLGNDSDADLPNDTLTVSLDTDVNFGSLTLNADGTFDYTHNGSENFSDSFVYAVSDANGGVTDTSTVTITITPVNDNDPVATDDGFTLNEGATFDTTVADLLDSGFASVLGNDSDADLPNDTLTVSLDTDVSFGTLTLNANGTFDYTHNGSENFSDSFVYAISDANGGVTDTGTVTITVTPVNDNDPVAADDSFTLNEGAAFDSTAADLLDSGFASVLGNDSDADLPNDTLTVSLDTDVSFGSLTLNADGTFDYTHNGSENFSDSFVYAVSDANGGVTDTGTVTITITPVNDNDPVATDDGFALNEGATFDTTVADLLDSGFASVLGNDSDADLPNDTLTVSLDTDVSFGTLTLNADGTFDYTHNGSENFSDSFVYAVSDANGGVTDTGTVTITVTPVNDNDPVATDDGFTLNEGATFDTTVADLLDSGFASVLGNDSDADLPNDTLTVSLDTDVSFGTLTLNANGTFDYTHNGSENFSDSFVYAVSDANSGVTDTGTVTITVTPVNDNDPVATDDSFTLNEGAAFDTTAADLLDSGFASVLGNDSDADLPNDTLTVSLDTDVNFGSLTLNADGTFDYTHNGSENFSDSFVYAVSDANGGVTDTGTVTITVTPVNDNDPVATDDSFTLNEGAAFDSTAADLLDSGFASVLGNDSDADLPNDTLTVSLDTDVSFGTLTLNADGTFDYTHNGSENFSDSFVYAVSDANGGVTDTGTVTITITPVNDNDPVATGDGFALNEGATFDTTVADLLDSGFASVLGNDSDADLPNDTLTVSLDTDVSFGSLTLNADGTFDYTHNGSENFSDSFVYAVSDANGGATDTGTVTITITPVNDNDPVATDDGFALNEGATFDTTIADLLDSGFASVLGNDSDADLPNDTLTVSLDTEVSFGSLTLNADGTFDYIHNGSENFSDSFVYAVSDANGGVTDTGTVTITITPVNDNDPVATDDGFTLNEGATFDTTVADLLDSGFASVLGNDSDADLPNDTLTVSLDTDVSFGSLTLNADGTFDYTHNGSSNFTDSFVYSVSDANGGVTDTGTVTITVTPVNDNDPVATDDGFTLNEGATFDTTAADLLDSGFASVLGNDSDADLPDDTLTVSLDTDVNFGSLTLNADGTFDYTHNGSENFSDSFVYAVSDANGGVTDTGTVTITITPVNDNDPVATGDGFTLNEGATFDTAVADLLDSGFASVLGNDSDADLPNDTLTVSLDTDVSFGTLTLNADGTFDYTHNGSENFSDSFVYAVSDANGGVTDTGTVTITVTPVNDNDPVATDDSFTLNEGAAFDTTAADLLDSGFASVLGNDGDSDLPNDTLTVSLDTDVSFGSLTLNADGTFDYTHNGSENFSDSFVYAVSDANGGVTDTGTVTITITPVNDNDPVATDDGFTLNEGATFDTTVADLLDSGFASVLGNDSDADLPNDTLTVSLDTDVSFGTLTLNADGAFDYTHNGSENFSDSFVYAVSDANGGVTDTGTVTITVTPVNDNDPVATDDSFTLNEGAAFDTTAADLLDSGFASVLGNDSDADLPNDTLTVSLDTDVSFGTLTLNADGTFDYTHNGSENFSDSFVYAVSDANGGVTDTGTVTITVTPVNDNDPVATDDGFTLNEGATFDTTVADLLDSGFASVLGNDSDADLPNDTLTVSLDTDVSFGTLTLNADGTFDYTHNGSENFSDSFVYAVSDANGGGDRYGYRHDHCHAS